MSYARAVFATLALLFTLGCGELAMADGWWGERKYPPLDHAHLAYEYDDFLNNVNTSGSIGKLGWSFSGGTMVNGGVSFVGHVGVMNRLSGTTAATYSFALANASFGWFRVQENWEVTWIVNPYLGISGSSDADIYIGIQTGNTGIGVDGLYVSKLASDSNWFAVSRRNNVETRVDSGVPVASGWMTVKLYRVSSSDIGFSINGVQIATLTTTSTSNMLPWIGYIFPGAGTTKGIAIDFFSLLVTGISR